MNKRARALFLALSILGVAVWLFVKRADTEPVREVGVAESDAPSMSSASKDTAKPSTDLAVGDGGIGRKPASPEAMVVVLDPEGRPVPNCLLIGIRGIEGILGKSDRLGECRVPAAAGGLQEVEAQCEGFCPVRTTLSSSIDRQSIVLRRYCEISGSVGCLGGTIPAGAHVMAIPESLNWSKHETLDDLLADPRIKSATINADGSYSLGQLCESDACDVYAVCRGFVPTIYGQSVKPPKQGFDLQIAKLFGVRIQYVDNAGGPLQAGPLIYSSQNPTIQASSGAAIPVNALSGILKTLIGLPPDSLRESSRFDELVLYASRDAASEPGPLSIWGHIPGYERYQGVVMMPALATIAEPPVHKVALARATSGFGQLAIRFKGSLVNGLPTMSIKDTRSFLYLIDEDETYIEIPMPDLSAGPHLVDGVPFGTYAVQFGWRSLPFRYPPEGVVATAVIDETPEHVEIDCSGVAAVRLEFPSGTALSNGDIRVVVVERHTSRTLMPTCSAAGDFFIVGLLPGEFKFEVPTASLETEWVYCPAGSVARAALSRVTK